MYEQEDAGDKIWWRSVFATAYDRFVTFCYLLFKISSKVKLVDISED